MKKKIALDFYQQDDVVFLARELLGKVLCTRVDGVLTSGIIMETEAYNGRIDRACHAYGGRRTARTETLYQAGGVSYVYLCYGLHHLFNVVTNVEGVADAILVRAIQPLEGLEKMQERRNTRQKKQVLSGPGVVSRALGIERNKHNNLSLRGNEIWIEERGLTFSKKEVKVGPRIGVDYAGEDAKLPWRFLVKT